MPIPLFPLVFVGITVGLAFGLSWLTLGYLFPTKRSTK